MISRCLAILAALGVAIYPALPALPASDPDLLAGLDTDHDCTVSLDEAKKAAEVLINSIVITTALSPGDGLTVVWLARLFAGVTA